MNELNMSIYTGKENENKVTLTASFGSHDEAVQFHTGLATLCDKYSKVSKPATSWFSKPEVSKNFKPIGKT